MSHAKGKLKLTGDTHLPDAESDLDIEEGTSSIAALAHERDQRGRPQVRRAGVLLAPQEDTGPQAEADANAPVDSNGRKTRQAELQPRTPWGVWLGALTAAVVFARLMR